MGSLIQDLGYSVRTFAKNSGFTSIVVVMLAGGIGLAATILSIANAVLFSTLPYKDADRLVYIWETNEHSRFTQAVSYANFADWENQNQVLEDLTLLADETVTLTGGGEPERLRGIRISAHATRLLGLKLALGRPFVPEEYGPGRSQTLLLSHGLWQRRFGSKPEILSQTLAINAEPHSVAGVVSEDFKLGVLAGFEPDFWLPLTTSQSPDRSSRSFLAVARLKPGVTLERAQGDMAIIGRRLERQYPETNAGWTIEVAKLRSVDPIVYVLLVIAVGSILGVVCLNVANLLLARGTRREKEIAVRAALGATRRRVLRQLLTETVSLASLGCCLGILLAAWTCKLIKLMSAGTNLGLVDVRVDSSVLGATLLLTLLSGVAMGLAPAVHMSRIDLNHSLKEEGSSLSTAFSRRRLKSALVLAEAGLSLVLLNGAGLALKSLYRLLRVDPGFHAQRVLTMDFALPERSYPQKDQQSTFFQHLLRRLESRPNIESAAVASSLPTAGPAYPFTVSRAPKPRAGEEPRARFTVVSSRYFATLTIPLKAGRSFTEQDSANALPVAIVNETLARQHGAGQLPLGTELEVAGVRRSIVGVVGDVRSAPLKLVPTPEIYVPLAQHPGSNMSLLVRTSLTDPLRIVGAVKNEVQTADPHLPVAGIQTMEKVLARNMGAINMGTMILAGMALGALFLTAVGIYGVLSYLVSQRTREVGIRMALGARSGHVVKMLLKEGLTPVVLGVIPGLAVSFGLGCVLASRIYGLSPFEPLILAVTCLLLMTVALLACYFPARRATKVNPVVALRYE